ncbi:Uncharacterised protein [Actinobacillus equuli]|nr:Uncharacterised protein [Actinobacillus equuli]
MLFKLFQSGLLFEVDQKSFIIVGIDSSILIDNFELSFLAINADNHL